MDQISGISGAAAGGVSSAGPKRALGREEPAPAGRAATSRAADRVEISDRARELGAASVSVNSVENRPIRTERLERIRAQIQAGTYETPEKLDYAVDRLTKSLDVRG